MRLAYVDESYTRDRFHLGALLVDDDCAWTLADNLDAVVARAVAEFPGVPRDAELHGYALLQGKEDWAALRGAVRARIHVYDEALRAVARSGAEFILCDLAVDPATTFRPAELHASLLPHLLEEIEEYAWCFDEPVLVVADEVGEHEQHRTSLRDFRISGTPGDRSSRLRLITDTLHFSPSRHSRFIQAVDLVTFLHGRRQGGADQDPRAAAASEALWRRIEGCLWRTQRLLTPPETHKGPARSGA